MKIIIKRNDITHRNFVAKELRSNPLYRSKIVVSKKVYNRKKIKQMDSKMEV